jgi:site-specific DNA-methyltransferase (adenine-specific)
VPDIGVKYDGHNDRMTPAAYRAWCRSWIGGAVRLLAPTGSMWVLINHEESPHMRLALEDAGLHWRQTITWYERFGVNCTDKFNRSTRPLFWMTKHPEHFTFNADAVNTNSDRLGRYRDKRANLDGKNLDDLWDIPRLAGTHGGRAADFPTQLPPELLLRIVGCASDRGDLVLDPLSGSGTTGVACIALGRRYIGIEKSERDAEASRRLLQEYAAGDWVLPSRPKRCSRMTNADKKSRVEAALRHPAMSKRSNREIATMCDVSHMTVNRYRSKP